MFQTGHIIPWSTLIHYGKAGRASSTAIYVCDCVFCYRSKSKFDVFDSCSMRVCVWWSEVSSQGKKVGTPGWSEDYLKRTSWLSTQIEILLWWQLYFMMTTSILQCVFLPLKKLSFLFTALNGVKRISYSNPIGEKCPENSHVFVSDSACVRTPDTNLPDRTFPSFRASGSEDRHFLAS